MKVSSIKLCLFTVWDTLPEIHNAEMIIRQDICEDELIDVLMGNRVYLPALYVYNKIDRISIKDIDQIARKPRSVVISCNYRLNFDYLLDKIWEYLSIIRVYTKKPGEFPDLKEPLILRSGATVREAVC
ncbi:Developmentally-regulated GTP-binding protein 2 [Thelohanellus kitauei]|uniref:Developmentally-regulated GTP-binding protein 2 n=1 Tax=Thelohanellus kitauei TaxID=669202 RepID=A0A0C2MW95_THEKT|nr:Developmentally-regulated GTP-binding protein 2 [Thelohanellus kitauei]